MRHTNLTHANFTLAMLAGSPNQWVSAEAVNKALDEMQKKRFGKAFHRTSTYLWEIRQKLGQKVESKHEGRMTVAYMLVVDPKKAAAVKKAAKDEAKLFTVLGIDKMLQDNVPSVAKGKGAKATKDKGKTATKPKKPSATKPAAKPKKPRATKPPKNTGAIEPQPDQVPATLEDAEKKQIA